MNENRKLEEAEYFLAHLRDCISDQKKFVFEVSAFLSAARSVMQYACKEVKTKEGGKSWYDNHMGATHEIKYFRDKRNENIHSVPVIPNPNIKHDVSMQGSAAVKAIDPDGNIIGESYGNSSEVRSETLISYRFSDWSGTEDVETLCIRYLQILKDIVNDGQTKGFLSK